MRIVAGKYKGRPLRAPASQKTRPTGDRARETVFNMLEHAAWAPSLADARIIDLFAGSGALGFEALSRGASFCLFVETDHAARGAIRDNIETLNVYGQTRVHRRSATALGRRPAGVNQPFSHAFLDPPYHNGLVAPTLDVLHQGDWLAPDALIIAETAHDTVLEVPDWSCVEEREVGAAKFWFLQRRRTE